MKTTSLERGQALILIVFAIIGLFGVTALAVDGGMAYSDRRAAQNAADNAALAAALAHSRARDVKAAALGAANTNGFNNNGTTNTVIVTMVDATDCPYNGKGKHITVQITSRIQTYFGPVLGIRRLTNIVQAVTLSCDSYIGPPFPGNAIVALGPTGIGFDAAGTPNWRVENGGIFSNSSSSPSARCKGAADVSAPSLTVVGTVVGGKCSQGIGTTTTGSPSYAYDAWSRLMPPVPECKGKARQQGLYWVTDPDPNADGSQVALNGGNMSFAPGLYCVTNSPGPYHGQITGVGVTFYLMDPNFSIKFNGGGGFGAPAIAPTSGDYAGVLMFSLPKSCVNPLQNTQSIDLRGNGTADIIGSILVPCASVTAFGNSSSSGYQSQIVAYNVDSGGTSNIYVNYNAKLDYQTAYPAWINLLK